ncbi:hypothetical protein D9756_009247 [Leucocoprinus leucothites]|uniref:Transmembrane protein n=1 Tax=Leucocoprinus leucothites TaxID=201217 RepID=A0A8H5CXV8_9AGAR|nr:hypothetical protein D9756_009247 [Leucoagaricus leucothites]
MAYPPLLNPDTYLNHLPPDVATQLEITRNIYMTILGASIWDVLIYVPNDVKIVTSGFGLVTLCFIFSRVFAITYALLFVLVQTHPITNCMAMNIAMGLTCLLAMGCTSFLFLRRLHAVYSQQRIIRWLFSFLWFGITGMTVCVIIGTDADHIDGTGYCIMYQIHSYTAVGEFLPAVFDTLVFFTISYKLISDQALPGIKRTNWTSFFTADLPLVSRALLKGGQQYYMIVFWITVASGVMLYTPSVPVMYRPMLTLASTTLSASMACRVFRNMKNYDSSLQASEASKISDIWFARSQSTELSWMSSGVVNISRPPHATEPISKTHSNVQHATAGQ